MKNVSIIEQYYVISSRNTITNNDDHFQQNTHRGFKVRADRLTSARRRET